ncbi:hypothetical protein F511_44005 [Dorcoceras hygrometricum]|uniref:Uncharacterized protein n=1 Tax=Dorcoceras hygrometricum TaxID=472368 RepID=A0A2Z6ZY74_9LAMI|nr:hypothetical protein F511_44005 [Dorcoceras hygrometricum]
MTTTRSEAKWDALERLVITSQENVAKTKENMNVMRTNLLTVNKSLGDLADLKTLAAGLGETPMHVGVDASLSRIHRSQTCVDILCYLRG